MPYNGSGTFTLSQPAFVPNTPISSSAVNSDLSDIATGLSTAITKDGQTTITAAIKFANGAVGLPAITFASDTDNGIYRIGANNYGLSAGGSLILAVATTGIAITGTLSASGQFTATGGIISGDGTVSLPAYSWTGDTNSGMYRIGADNIGIAVNATKILDISTTGLNVIGSVSSNGSVLAPASQTAGMINGTIVASVAANALTVALKTASGADPSSGNPVTVLFRNATVATGDYATLTLTAATSIVISSGSTLGTLSSNIPFRLWLVGFNDASTFRLALINCTTATQIFPLNEGNVQTSIAEGGAGGADSAGVFYTGTAATSKAIRILGYLDFSAGQTTAGSWATAPDILQLFGPGIKKPGDLVQPIYSQSGAYSTGAGTTYSGATDTLPTSSNGGTPLSLAITPTSKPNKLIVDAQLIIGITAGTGFVGTAYLIRDAGTAIAVNGVDAVGNIGSISLHYEVVAGQTTSTTFNLYGAANGGTVAFNGVGGRFFGGFSNTFIRIQELMA